MNKSKLLVRVQEGQTIVEGVYAKLSDAERNRVGTLEHWSAKDTLAHIAAWQTSWVNWLAPLSEGRPLSTENPPQVDQVDDENRANAEIFAANQHRSWVQIHGDYQNASRQILKLAALVSEEDLNIPPCFAQHKQDTLGRRLAGTFYWHIQEHLTRFFIERKNPTRALEIAEEFSRQMGADDTAAERGTALYNLACYAALTGRRELALTHLKTALFMYPELIEWSKKDSDLDVLREDAEFKALFATLPAA
jgi:tetratricopeptide (TPR) repeat protein